ncbi:MAG: hypothetical protein JO316_19415 [Abitibacteriaceae bacterium]|nr:hypothetical protein [Abditibacteriaceae bacterium]MBV9867526.1 hypothetical protein [Abditibacteriaceae bacterium]
MLTNRVTAVFDNRAQAEQAVNALQNLGVTDAHMSIISRHGEDLSATGTGTASATAADAADVAADKAGDVGRGVAAGAGVGALFGLAAALIPGVGPFITAGALLAHALGAVGGGMVAGAVVGGTSGAVAGALTKAGYTEHEANYYGGEIERGGVFVAVDTGGTVDVESVRSVLSQYGGRSAAVA